jgi:hypothetical protein
MLVLNLLLQSCGNQSPASLLQTKQITKSEALVTYQAIVAKLRNYYGPLEYKERRFGFDFDRLAAEYEARLPAQAEDIVYFAIFKEFLARFRDGHLHLDFASSSGLMGFSLPFTLLSIEDKTIVSRISEDAATQYGISNGDVLTTIDGQTPQELMPIILKYSAFGHDLADKHLVSQIVNRPAFAVGLHPKHALADLTLSKADGSIYSVQIPWELKKNPQLLPLSSHGRQDFNPWPPFLSEPIPFFATPQVDDKFDWTPVEPKEHFLDLYEVNQELGSKIFAVKYRYQNKNILLIRQGVYSHGTVESDQDYMKLYKAILDQEDDSADVLVIDQNRNGGGNYCIEFSQIFFQQPQNFGHVQALNPDQKWIDFLRERSVNQGFPADQRNLYEQMADETQQAYDRGLFLTKPISVWMAYPTLPPMQDYAWKKPILVLADELSGSCADIFPMLMKANNTAKIFGQRTSGHGGNLEAFELPNSNLLKLTRGLFTAYQPDQVYEDADFIENNGVNPDFLYDHTLTDFRAGYVGYVHEFSRAAIQQIP